MISMKIRRSVLFKIKETLGTMSPEEGGMLLSNDGGLTITDFIFDPNSDRSGVAYSPNSDFLNTVIKEQRDKGNHFAGIIHSHPNGLTGLSRGFGGGFRSSGYTASDEEAIYKLCGDMRSTPKLYFPVVQSEYGGNKFSMRAFAATRDVDNNVTIKEEPIEVVDDKSRIPQWFTEKYYGSKDKGGATLMLVGLENSGKSAEKLALEGVKNFILIDNVRFQNQAKDAVYGEQCSYKADAITKNILRINPFANVKIIRQQLNEKISSDTFEEWTSGYDLRKTVLCLCTDKKSVSRRAKRLATQYKIKFVTALRTSENSIETFYKVPGKARAYRLKYYYLNDTIEDITIDVLNEARKDAVLVAMGSNEPSQEVISSTVKHRKQPNKWDTLYPEEVISQKTVVIIGVGGSRSYAENLARAGIKKFVLIDGDKYGRSNMQTQTAFIGELGRYKAQVTSERIKEINPHAEVTVITRMLDEKISDEKFAEWVGADLKTQPQNVLIAACTDNFKAQARCSRLALKYGCPYVQAGIYTGGRILEIIFFHPKISKVCPRCMLTKRYQANLSAEVPLKPAVSDGTSIFFTEELNAKKGYLSLALLLYREPNADTRYSDFLDDNKWVTHGGKHSADRNFMFYTLDSHLERSTGIKAYRKFDEWGRLLGSRYQVGVSYFMKKKPKKGCPDCGGKGNLNLVKGAIKDTREGIYYNVKR